MEFFRNPSVNWLGWKWYFLAFSMIFSVAGIVKMTWNWSHIGSPVPLGVDFRGGTQLDVQFANPPDIEAIRKAIESGWRQGRDNSELRGAGERRSAHQPTRRDQRDCA